MSGAADMRRENRAAFASGMTGCGKSQLLWDWFTSRHPRRLSYDPVGDTVERNPQAVPVRTAAEFREHVGRAIASRCDSWHFVIWGEPEEAIEALEWLAPDTTPPHARSLCRALGGVLFESGEVDTLAPNASTPTAVRFRGKLQRGRHHLLSHALATQAPALVNRIVTANCHDIFAFSHAEHTSLEYFAKQIGERAAERIARLPQYGFLHYHKGDPFATEYASEKRGGSIVRRPVARIPLAIGAATVERITQRDYPLTASKAHDRF